MVEGKNEASVRFNNRKYVIVMVHYTKEGNVFPIRPSHVARGMGGARTKAVECDWRSDYEWGI